MSIVVCCPQRTLKQLEREQTDTLTHTHTHTHTHVNYRNPRACAPRVNELVTATLNYSDRSPSRGVHAPRELGRRRDGNSDRHHLLQQQHLCLCRRRAGGSGSRPDRSAQCFQRLLPGPRGPRRNVRCRSDRLSGRRYGAGVERPLSRLGRVPRLLQ